MAVDYTKLTASTLVRIGFIRDVTFSIAKKEVARHVLSMKPCVEQQLNLLQ